MKYPVRVALKSSAPGTPPMWQSRRSYLLIFPRKCVYCNEEAATSRQVSVSVSSVEGSIRRTRNTAFDLPYCEKHGKTHDNLNRLVLGAGVVWTIIAMLVVLFIGYKLAAERSDWATILIGGAFIFTLIMAPLPLVVRGWHMLLRSFYPAARDLPLRAGWHGIFGSWNGALGLQVEILHSALELRFTNEEYAREFASANSDSN